ncbi:MAG: RdgB/HAM1 family non-canonical purine NTP pyrophosphatase [Spirochaetales bacterium]|nr:RdgB/HAM1 family non-canonical purine NTP pyrophosphatase [Spirochaetales bacterium]
MQCRLLKTELARLIAQHGICLGSNNPHKVEEFRRLLPSYNFYLPARAGISFAPVEDGATFAENALIKARALSAVPVALADDSGLVIPSLGGRPGLHSARYGGPDLSDADRCLLVLKELENSKDRRAYFICVLALCGAGEEYLFEGRVEGEINHRPEGVTGFGYDPIFFHPISGCTLAQLAGPAKDAISHRGEAARQLKEFIDDISE